MRLRADWRNIDELEAALARWARTFSLGRRQHLHETVLRRAVREAVKAAGIPMRATCHTFRHSFATHLLDKDTDIRVLHTFLGWPDGCASAFYTRVLARGPLGVRSPVDRPPNLLDEPLPWARGGGAAGCIGPVGVLRWAGGRRQICCASVDLPRFGRSAYLDLPRARGHGDGLLEGVQEATGKVMRGIVRRGRLV